MMGYVRASDDSDTYGCDGCGERFAWDDIHWFTSSIGFCEKCDILLHKKVPQSVLDFCYDECEGGSDEVAEFIVSQVR